jgi:DNA processing protein
MTSHSIAICPDSRYPPLLKQLRDPPKNLYYKGNLDLIHTSCLAIVGTRKPSVYGNAMAAYFAKGLLSYGLTLVSGLAFGIDAIVHEIAVEEGGKTIAVLGNGLDRIYPERHVSLAQKMLKKHNLILSEYAPGAPSHKHHFPQRNRIISGLSLATLVIEAPIQSGALITAKHAFEQNRDVFAVPCDLGRESGEGCNILISSDMARLVRTPEEVVHRLRSVPQELFSTPQLPSVPRAPTLVTRAQKQLWKALSPRPVHPYELLKTAQLSVEEVSMALSYLEVKGFVRKVGGKYIKVPASPVALLPRSLNPASP